MKLLLHSDQSVNLTLELDKKLITSLTGKRNPTIGYIPSCPDVKRKYFAEKQAYYKKIGFESLIYFDPEESADSAEWDKFFTLDCIHLSGGDPVAFYQRLVATGCDTHLRKFIESEKLVLGISAGAMLLAKTFYCNEIFDKRAHRHNCQGFGFFDFEIMPHTSEKFPNHDLLKTFAKKIGKQIYALNDGDAIALNGKKIQTYGSPTLIG